MQNSFELKWSEGWGGVVVWGGGGINCAESYVGYEMMAGRGRNTDIKGLMLKKTSSLMVLSLVAQSGVSVHLKSCV